VPAKKDPSELGLYFEYLTAIVRPGKTLRTFATVPKELATVSDLDDWEPEQLQALADEGRARISAQNERFDRIRQTAQVVLPTGVGLLVVVGTELHRIVAVRSDFLRWALYIGWALSVSSVLLGTLGAGAILVTKAVFGSVFPTRLSQVKPSELEHQLARTYAEQSIVGEDTVNTRLTLQWWSVAFLAVGGLLFAVLWLIRELT
jgi:hypothetical protein